MCLQDSELPLFCLSIFCSPSMLFPLLSACRSLTLPLLAASVYALVRYHLHTQLLAQAHKEDPWPGMKPQHIPIPIPMEHGAWIVEGEGTGP